MSSAIRTPAFSSAAIPSLSLPKAEKQNLKRLAASSGRILLIAALCTAFLSLAFGRQNEFETLLVGVLLLASACLSLRWSRRPWLWFRGLLGTLIGFFILQLALRQGGEYSFLWFYMVPPTVFFLFGHREGATWSLLVLAGAGLALFLPSLGAPYDGAAASRFLLSFAISSVLAFEVEHRRRRHTRSLIQNRAALKKAMKDIETLQGLLPICVGCQRIRDDKGFWTSVGAYLSQHSLAEITEALCRDCRAEQTRETKTRGAKE